MVRLLQELPNMQIIFNITTTFAISQFNLYHFTQDWVITLLMGDDVSTRAKDQ